MARDDPGMWSRQDEGADKLEMLETEPEDPDNGDDDDGRAVANKKTTTGATLSPAHAASPYDGLEQSLTHLVTLDLILERVMRVQAFMKEEGVGEAEGLDVMTHYFSDIPVKEVEWYLDSHDAAKKKEEKIISATKNSNQQQTSNNMHRPLPPLPPPKARISKVAADLFGVEALKSGDHFFIHCMRGLNWFQISSRGVVGSYCFRRVIDRHVKFLLNYWVNVRGFQAMPEEGTLLAIFRNGEMGAFPWDSDFDLKFYTELDMDRHDFKKELEAHINETNLMPTQAWNFDGCSADHYFLIRIPNITHHVGDVYFNHRKEREENPWNLKLFNFANMSISQHHLEHIYFDRYHGPVEKRFGDHGKVLQCWSEWHTACLPNCAGKDSDAACEFEDNFVHVDNWEMPENELTFWPEKRDANFL